MKKGSSRRRQAREIALQVMYAIDLNPLKPKEALRRHWASFGHPDLGHDTESFLVSLVERCCIQRDQLDAQITAASRNWRLERMAVVDRNLLRLATCELADHVDVPTPVILNEAVEVAKRYGTTSSRSFINGVLDRIAGTLRPEGRL